MEKHLRVYENRSEYYTSSSDVKVFHEGIASDEAKKRIKRIKESFQNGFLDNLITGLKKGEIACNAEKVDEDTKNNLRQLVELVTSEVGRALTGPHGNAAQHQDNRTGAIYPTAQGEFQSRLIFMG